MSETSYGLGFNFDADLDNLDININLIIFCSLTAVTLIQTHAVLMLQTEALWHNTKQAKAMLEIWQSPTELTSLNCLVSQRRA